nr:hypothetical protein [Tanacetum cinerariifolium]
MLAPSGRGLILYQAYGNLYAITGSRKPACVCIAVDTSREMQVRRKDIIGTQIPNPPFDRYTEESDNDTEMIFDKELFLREQNTADVTPQSHTYTPPPLFLATMEPLDTLLMGDEVISATLARKNDKFIKSSVDDLVPIPKKSVETLVSTDLECSMPIDLPPLPCTDVLVDAKVDIDLPFSGHLDTFSIGDREIDFNPRDIETNDPIPDQRMFVYPKVMMIWCLDHLML